ncbi:hypothetical protein RRG08_049237 [Elysia crispata]|uniref:Uncharacterized protein n=1 Tax=Elysia crispata TaxID=231223 RepID=A0AAE1A0P9_9GAST|nr:hypothetical protein RRG08_049237 [Elysia crispata]
MEMNSSNINEDAAKLEYNNGRNVVYGRRCQQLPYDPVKDLHFTNNKTERAKSLIDLPPNIRHMFGSRVCDSLLSDAEKVNRSLEKRKAMSGPPRPSKKEDVKSLSVNFDDNYESLGATTRYNMFPGLTSGHTISRTQQEFNDEVHLRRVPNPDEFRYQRDELSIWVEQDVLRARMQKRWKNYFESLPKATINWDRSATRTVKVPDKPTPKSKPKIKPKPQEKVQKETEEEIIFVTPPLTPPPAQPDIVEIPSTFKRDDEFWEFFDQPIPR